MARFKYTEEHEEYLKRYSSDVSRETLTRMFNERFLVNQSVTSIKSHVQEKGYKGRNKWGLGVDIKPKDPTRYKIGDERVYIGELFVIVKPPQKGLTMLQRCEYKKRIVWREHYGEIPPKHFIIHLDGNKMNCNIENLACLPLIYIRIMQKNGWLKGDVEVTKTAIEWCKLHYSISEKDTDGRWKMNGKRFR